MTKSVFVGNVQIGGGAPVSVQSMTNTDTADALATAEQILKLESLGCEIVRVSVNNIESANAIAEIKKKINIPLVADIHFDYRLALLSIKNGIDKLRINPGNIGSKQKVKELVSACKDKGVPIRIGVNGGSLQKELLEKYKAPTAEALVESALEHIGILEDQGFYNIIVSLKSSDVPTAVKSYKLMAAASSYPLHIGITEAGRGSAAMIKSAAGLGALLLDGIGDTMRVSMTGSPLPEIKAAYDILRAVGVRKRGIELISCPTCARTSVDLEKIVIEIENRLPKTDKPLKVAVMGCVVNGLGEGREADVGIAFAPRGCVLFKSGEKLGSCQREEAIEKLLELVEQML